MDAKRVIAVWSLYTEIEKHRRAKLQEARRASKMVAEQEIESAWIVEGLYHLAFAIRKLADRANIDIFDFDQVSPLIPEAERRLAEFVKDRPNISTYRLFRNAATKQNLFRASLNEQPQQLSLL